MSKLMTENEVVERLHNGEDPLELSIEKWERLVEAAQQDDADMIEWSIGSSTCALCHVYVNSNGCHGCPVMERTGKPGCQCTPFSDATYALFQNNQSAFVTDARLEVEFLKSLRKELHE